MNPLPIRLVATSGLAVLALLLSSCAAPLPAPASAPIPHPHTAAPLNAAVLDPPRSLPDLTLQRADGRRFSTADTRSRTSLFFFGYTNCPDVCPLTMVEVAQVRKLLGAQAQLLDVYFVTVDPERDTVQRLAEYTAKFDPAIVAMTGTAVELRQARNAFGVVAQKRPLPNSTAGYFVDHTAGLHFVDAESRITMVYPYGSSPEDVAADLQRLLPAAQHDQR